MKTQEFKKGQLVKCPKGDYHISFFLEVTNSYDSIGNRIKHVRDYFQEGFEIMIKGIGVYTAEDISVIEEKSDREKAIQWWNKLRRMSISEGNGMGGVRRSWDLVNKYFPDQMSSGKGIALLNGDQIEHIWRKETQQESQKGIVITKEERLQVDFGMLKALEEQCDNLSNHIPLLNQLFDNYKLFLNLLSKSSTFAHKAHKELQKLQK